MPGESVTQFTGWEGKSFPLRCLRVVEAVEDTWTPLYITVESILTESEEQGVGMAVTLTNVYGDFDLHGCNTTLTDDEDEKMRGTKKVRWEDGTLSGWLEPKHIASHICTSLAEETEPDEEDPDAAVQSLPTAHVAEFDMIVHIWELNDPPDISDPQKCYFRPGCYGDLRDVRITSGGTKYYTELMTETGPVKVAAVRAEAATSKQMALRCLGCATPATCEPKSREPACSAMRAAPA